MIESRQIVVFSIDDIRFAVPISSVEYIIKAVEVYPFPGSPELLLGIINYHGETVPVINLRQKLRLKDKPVSSNDYFIVSRTGERKIVFVADKISGYLELDVTKIKNVHAIWPGISRIESIASWEDEYILITNFMEFLSSEENDALNAVLSEVANHRKVE